MSAEWIEVGRVEVTPGVDGHILDLRRNPFRSYAYKLDPILVEGCPAKDDDAGGESVSLPAVVGKDTGCL